MEMKPDRKKTIKGRVRNIKRGQECKGEESTVRK